MKLVVDGGFDSSLDALGKPSLDLLCAARDRVTFQRDLQRRRARVWRSGGDDQAGVLVGTLRRLTEFGQEDGAPATHSVRSLLATSLNGRHSVYVAIDCLGDHDHPLSVSSVDGDQEQELAADDLNPLIERSPVLEGRDLIDLSFEIPAADRHRAVLLQRCTALARHLEFPISHLHLPSCPAEGTRFRIGMGLDPAQPLRQHDLLARSCAIAEEFGVGLRANSTLLREWTLLVSDQVPSPSRGAVAVGWQAQLVAQAHVGLIADIVERLAGMGLAVDHAAMTIIEGCTVITLGGASEVGVDELEDGFSTLALTHTIISRTILRPGAGRSAASEHRGEPVWVGWWCDNTPGGLVALLDALQGPLGDDFNITYVASRMVRGGRLNAGKLRAEPRESLPIAQRIELVRNLNTSDLPTGLRISLADQDHGLTHKSSPIRLR